MTIEQIRAAIPKVETALDLLNLLNKVKKDIYGDKCHPFSLKLLNYYRNPSRVTKAYVQFKIPKKSGGFREISAPTKSLKSMLTCLNVLFQALYEPSPVAKGFLPGRSVVDNAQPHVGMLYVFNTDLKDFFPSITQARVWKVLQMEQYGFGQEAASIIAGLCCMRVVDDERSTEAERFYKYVLPQGAPTSPILTNMICQKLDRRLQGIAKRFNLHCTRYADDITFSGMYNVFQKDGEFRQELKRVIEDQNLKINIEKTRLQKKCVRQEVTGLVVSDKVNVPREYVRDLKSILYIWEKYGRESAAARFVIHYHEFKATNKSVGPQLLERVLMGKLMYLRMVKGENDAVFVKLFYRFLALCTSKSKDLSRYSYDLVYKITNFEKVYESDVHIKLKRVEGDGAENVSAYGITRIQGKNVYVLVSKQCMPAIVEAMSSGEDSKMAEIKSSYYMVLCVKEGKKPFWMIMKSNPNNALKPETLKQPELVHSEDGKVLDIHYPLKQQVVETQTGNIDNILSEFVESNFDLSVLDKWDRINNN